MSQLSAAVRTPLQPALAEAEQRLLQGDQVGVFALDADEPGLRGPELAPVEGQHGGGQDGHDEEDGTDGEEGVHDSDGVRPGIDDVGTAHISLNRL